MNVFLPKNLDINKIKYSELKVMKSGAKSVYLNYSSSKINIQTPVMNIPYGVNDNQKFIKDDPKRKDEPPKYDITVSFKGIDENPKIKIFHDKMKELEENVGGVLLYESLTIAHLYHDKLIPRILLQLLMSLLLESIICTILRFTKV